jgi:hypothetical protein
MLGRGYWIQELANEYKQQSLLDLWQEQGAETGTV